MAVTGTNGKTTTTDMVATMMRADGLDAIACGNIGHPFSLAAREGHAALAVEASSYQLRFQESLHPRVSVLLNLAPDHLDWHGSFEAYGEAKARIFARQGAGDVHLGNADDEVAAAISSRAPCGQRWFRLGEPGPGEVGFVGSQIVAKLEAGPGGVELGSPTSEHPGFRADAAAAAAAALSFGLQPAAVAEGVASVGPLPHRGQVVATAAGVEFIDDSKATNPHAALAALAGRTDVVLIAGGLAKGLDLSPLTGAADRLTGVVAFGASAGQVEDLFSGIRPVRRAESIEQAAELALELALASVPPGGCVVLAPGGASQDLFVDYRERGERFAQAAKRLASEHEGSEGTEGSEGG
ncbi:MAG: UDP-N-acetylmuramoyl-L-alanine--D-glutamate ligase, partial [Actinomycetota bacterium]